MVTVKADPQTVLERLGELTGPMEVMACEAHPALVWPHDDCPGPGMPWFAGLRHAPPTDEQLAAVHDAPASPPLCSKCGRHVNSEWR